MFIHRLVIDHGWVYRIERTQSCGGIRFRSSRDDPEITKNARPQSRVVAGSGTITGCHEALPGNGTASMSEILFSLLPSASITQSSLLPLLPVLKRIFFPSGDQDGSSLFRWLGSSVSCLLPVPSELIVPNLTILVFNSGPERDSVVHRRPGRRIGIVRGFKLHRAAVWIDENIHSILGGQNPFIRTIRVHDPDLRLGIHWRRRIPGRDECQFVSVRGPGWCYFCTAGVRDLPDVAPIRFDCPDLLDQMIIPS